MEVVHSPINTHQENRSHGAIAPQLYPLKRLSLPAKDPYSTYKWYCDVFGFTSKPSDNLNQASYILENEKYDYAIHFIGSDDRLQDNFHNSEGYNHTYILLNVKGVHALFENMKSLGVEIVNQSIKDRGGCGSEIRFIDPDGRVIEINDYN